jgi:transcriptional regulator with XRE-family HTH domain
VHADVQICHMDHAALAREVMRALRGKRSQTAFGRRLGYRSNVAYAWESGRRYPTAAEMFRAAARTRLDVRAAVASFFHPRLPDALATLDPGKPAYAAALLHALKGPAPMRVLAERTGLSRSAVSRLLTARTQPRLPVFFQLVDAASRRLLDLLAGLVDVSALPAARDEWRRVETMRRLAVQNPLSESVPRFLELDQYAALSKHRPGWIAARLGITREEEERTLRDLETAGVIRWDGTRWRIDRERSIDTTRSDRRAAAFLRGHWSDQGAARVRADRDGTFSYLVFTTDDATLASLRALHLDYFRQLRALVASSPRNTRVAVVNVQLFPIDDS